MRIAFVTHEYVTESGFDGGLANYIHRVSLSLLQLGHEVTVFVASDCNEHFVHQGIDVYSVKQYNRWLDLFNKLTYKRFTYFSWWIRQSLLLNRCLKMVHNTMPFSIVQYTSYAATGLFRLRNLPCVVRISSFESMLRKGHEKSCSWPLKVREWLELQAMKRVDDVFGPSHVVGNVVEAEINRPIKIIETPFVPDLVETDPAPYQDLLAVKKYLLFFGTLGKHKGVATIADMIQPLLEKYSDLWFVFVGKDIGYQGTPMMERVWKMAGSSRGRVLYVGKMRHAQLYPVLNGALAVVLPSRVDNFPNTCIEAFYYKKVVIGTRGASFEQLIDDGISGFLCEIDSPSGLMNVIERVLSLSETERNEIGEKAFERLNLLKPEIIGEQLVRYYKSVIENRLKMR